MTAVETQEAPAPAERQGPGAFAGVWLITSLELKQRIRSTKWIAALITVGALIALVTGLVVLAANLGGDSGTGDWVFGLIVYFVLFLGLIVSPTLSSGAINGDAKEGTLAPLQATGLNPSHIVFGKLLAAWIASLAFIVVALPFMIWAYFSSTVNAWAMVTVVIVLAVELLVVCALGMGWSAVTPRTAASAVLTFMTVAILTAVLPIIFGLLAALVSKEVEYTSSWREYIYQAAGTSIPSDAVQDERGDWFVCHVETYTTEVPRTEVTWWMLAVNPYVIVADSAPAPTRVDAYWDGGMLGSLKQAVRELRIGSETSYDDCTPGVSAEEQERFDEGASLGAVWPWGLAVQGLLAAGALWLAVRRVRVPYGKLASGTRVA